MCNYYFGIAVELVVPFRQTRGVGVVLTMGTGEVGQLGLGPDVFEKKRPILVKSLVDVVDVVAGGMHTVCLTAQGSIHFIAIFKFFLLILIHF